MRRTYLVTYSWTDKTEYLTRESFEEKIAKAFDMGFSKALTDYWAGGENYHFSIKLSFAKR